MRCMSKCVVNRSTRVYTVLLGGITFGFALSTVIQNLSFSEFGKSAGWTADYPSAVVRGGRASFSNLPAVAQQQPDEEQIDIGGYYDYERLVLLQEEKEEQKEGEERKELFSPSQQQQIASDALSDKMKRREYVKEGWQGRNVRETLEGNRLSDELATRRTLLVAVITSINKLMSQTLAVQGTWAQEAGNVIYFTGEVKNVPHLPHGMVVVQLEGLDDKQAGWELKELSVINYISTNYIESTDWVLIVGDETYVSPRGLETELNKYDAAMSVYLGRPQEGDGGEEEGGEKEGGAADKLCDSASGVVYSRGFLEQLKPYLPVCWPGTGGDVKGLSGCISVMGLKCTAAEQVGLCTVHGVTLQFVTRILVENKLLGSVYLVVSMINRCV